MSDLQIKYCDPFNHLDSVTLHYKLRSHAVSDKWAQRLVLAQSKYDIDDPGRFYGIGSIEQQQQHALQLINDCINTINSFESIIDRQLVQVDDQDTLNYLHHTFEIYHGLLDQQTHELWQRAPEVVRRALADLNILVHRCESVYRGAQPRHVVTWYGLPKTEQLDQQDYALFEDTVQFGIVYLNYVEIGKTLDDLAVDNDQYISDDAFRPFRHYSADFNVKFWTDDSRQVDQKRAKIKEYYDKNLEFFAEKNLPWGHPYLTSGSIPLADLDEDLDVIPQLTNRQWVKSVKLI